MEAAVWRGRLSVGMRVVELRMNARVLSVTFNTVNCGGETVVG